MVASVDRYLNALPSAEPLGSGMGTDAGTEPSDLLVSLGHTEVCTRLDKYFAVLNGASKRIRLSDCLHFV